MLKKTLKELKILTSDEENSKKAVLQNLKVLIQLQSIDGQP